MSEMPRLNPSQSIIDQIEGQEPVYLLRRSRGDYLVAAIEHGDDEKFLGAQDWPEPAELPAMAGMTLTKKTLAEAIEIALHKGVCGVVLIRRNRVDGDAFQVFRV